MYLQCVEEGHRGQNFVPPFPQGLPLTSSCFFFLSAKLRIKPLGLPTAKPEAAILVTA